MARHQDSRGRALVLVNLVALVAVMGVLLVAFSTEESPLSARGQATSAEASEPCCDLPPVGPPPPGPVERLAIPVLGVDAALVELGMGAGRQMEIPARPDVVAWYDFTAAPGESGNAVFAGHVNWRGGEGAVFQDLGRLEVGDEVRLVRRDGTALRYLVTSLETVDVRVTSAAAVVAPTEHELVTLITCHGEYDLGLGQFRDRLIVRAERTD